MATVVVQSDASNVTVSLSAFAMTLQRKDELMRIIGLGQLKSVRQTFRDGGSPSGSWAPLSDVSRRWRKYSSGHKLLIDSGLLLNSITFAAQGNSVVIGTGLSYASVHQYGFDGTQSVRPYSYVRRVRSATDERIVEISLTAAGAALKTRCACIPERLSAAVGYPIEK